MTKIKGNSRYCRRTSYVFVIGHY